MHKNRNQRRQKRVAIALSSILIAGGCAANSGTEDDKKLVKPTVAEQQPVEQPFSVDETKQPGKKPVKKAPTKQIKQMNKKEQILFAREDLAKRLEIPLEQVALSGAVAVKWKSGALGCPKPGEHYTQALVAGMSIMLRVENTAYRYHAKANGTPFHCPDNMAESPAFDNTDI